VNGRLARRYAKALLDLARSEGTALESGSELSRVVTAFEEPRLRPLCLSPALERSIRVKNTKQVTAALGLSKMVSNLIALLAERDRLALLPEVSRWYEALLDDELGRVRITIWSATPLGASQKNEIIEVARRLTKRREVLAVAEVDADLLGGVVLDANGTIYDGSLKTQLTRLSKEMAEGGA